MVIGGSSSSATGTKLVNGTAAAMGYAFVLVMKQRERGDLLPAHVIAELQPYFAEAKGFDLAEVRVRAGIPWYVRGAEAYTSGNTIYFAPGAYDPYSATGIALIGHEALHVQQFQALGRLRFYARYGLEYLGGRLRGLAHSEAYHKISLERHAFALQAAIRWGLWYRGWLPEQAPYREPWRIANRSAVPGRADVPQFPRPTPPRRRPRRVSYGSSDQDGIDKG